MASKDKDESFPTPQVPRSDVPGPPSIISSRMTDIASDDGQETETNQQSQRRSPDLASRPETARTGVSSRGAWPSQRRTFASGIAAKRESIGSSSAASIGRTGSMTSRSHVPSLTSHAFFRPMSSQKLQAQRGGTPRPPTMSSSPNLEENSVEVGGSVTRQSIISNPIAQVQRQRTLSDPENPRPPPSRGTEMTEQETLDRITANTSPSHGHYATGSMSDSVRPLQRRSDQNSQHLNIKIDKSYKDLANMPSPIKSPRSFRNSFLMPKNDQGQQSRNRSTEGAEKLSSSASSPQMHPVDTNGEPRSQGAREEGPKTKSTHVHQYFDGNMVFCFGGRWMNSRQRPINVATGLFVIIPCVLFFIFEAPWLWHNISPAIPVTFAYLVYLCFSSFIHASVSDPGVSDLAVVLGEFSTDLLRSYHVISTDFLLLMNMTIHFNSALLLPIGLSSNHLSLLRQLWKCLLSIAGPATSGGPRVLTIVACATIASRHTIITACGSTTASENATIDISLLLSQLQHFSPSISSAPALHRSSCIESERTSHSAKRLIISAFLSPSSSTALSRFSIQPH